jgi:hypothetical protein
MLYKRNIILALLLVACSSTPKQAPQEQKQATTMPSAPSLKPLLKIATSSPATTQATTQEALPGEISGRLYLKADAQCGGVIQRPGPPKPERGGTLLFRQGKKNDVAGKIFAEVKTNKEGRFSASSLPLGIYCIVEEAKRESDRPSNSGADCYKKWLGACDAVVELGAARVENVKITHEERVGGQHICTICVAP